LGRFRFYQPLLFFREPDMAPGPGGTAPMEHPYKSHTILITCWPTLEPFGFAPEIRISNKHQLIEKSFKFAQKFETKVEAEAYALAAAIKWIDDSTPELLKKAK
jgi:hypothetical protein